MSDAGCAPGFRADDLFVFTPLPCALQQAAHRVLVLVWFVIYVLAAVELLLGQARRTDRSPLPLRAAYTLWLVGWVALLGVLVAWPDAGGGEGDEHVGRRAPALLALLATTMVASAALAVGIHAHLVRTLGVTLGAFYPPGPTATQRPHASRYKTALRLSVWLCMAETLLHCACAVIFVAILPNVTPPGPDADAQRERFLVAAWICACFFQGLQAATLALLTWRLRMVVHKSLVFSHSEGSGSSNGGKGGNGGGDGGNGRGSNGSKTKGTMRPQDVHMARLQRRLTRNTFRLLVTSLVGAALFGVAAGLGLRFWIFHALAALGTFTIGTILAFFRPSVYASYRFGPCAASEDRCHGSVDSSTSAAAPAPTATAAAPAPAPAQRSPVLGPEQIDVDLVMEGKREIWPASQRNSLVLPAGPTTVHLGGLAIDMDELTTGIAAAVQHPSATSLALSTTSDAPAAQP